MKQHASCKLQGSFVPAAAGSLVRDQDGDTTLSGTPVLAPTRQKHGSHVCITDRPVNGEHQISINDLWILLLLTDPFSFSYSPLPTMTCNIIEASVLYYPE